MNLKMFNHVKLAAKQYDGQPVMYLHEKVDGHRLTVLGQPLGSTSKVMAVTREQTNLWPTLTAKAREHNIWHWLSDLNRLTPRSSLDGELYVPGRKASYVKTAIKECDPGLRFACFAVPWWGGERKDTAKLEWAMETCSVLGVQFTNFIKFDVPSIVNVEAALNGCPVEMEGYVAKVANYHKWYKIKRVNTIDCIVTSTKPGKGKYEGQIGALIASVYNTDGSLVDICACSGMTDAERAEMGESSIGRVIEVKYQEVLSVGRLRHPNFVRWRDDKQPSECTISQDLDLLQYWGQYGES